MRSAVTYDQPMSGAASIPARHANQTWFDLGIKRWDLIGSARRTLVKA